MLAAGVEAIQFAGDGHPYRSSGQALFHSCGEIAFNGSTERTFDFQAKPFRWVMAGGDHQGTEGFAFHHGPAAGWSWNGRGGEQRCKADPAHG